MLVLLVLVEAEHLVVAIVMQCLRRHHHNLGALHGDLLWLDTRFCGASDHFRLLAQSNTCRLQLKQQMQRLASSPKTISSLDRPHWHYFATTDPEVSRHARADTQPTCSGYNLFRSGK